MFEVRVENNSGNWEGARPGKSARPYLALYTSISMTCFDFANPIKMIHCNIHLHC